MAKSIEENLAALDEIVKDMETGEISLSESFKLYKDGIKLLETVNNQIDAVEKEVLMINKDNELVEFDGKTE